MERYKAHDYAYRVLWSAEDEGYVATTAEFAFLSHVSEVSPQDALTGMLDLVDGVLEDMYQRGELPPTPIAKRSYSGRLSLRITPEQHRRLALESAEQGVSINQLLVSRV